MGLTKRAGAPARREDPGLSYALSLREPAAPENRFPRITVSGSRAGLVLCSIMRIVWGLATQDKIGSPVSENVRCRKLGE